MTDGRESASSRADHSKFAGIYDEHFTRVYAFVMKRTGDMGAAEDLTAETFERAFRAIDRYEWRGAPLLTWLLRIADRACTDHFRRQARRREDSLAPESATLPHTRSAEDDALQADADSRLYAGLDALTPARRQIVILHLGEGLSLAEIARQTSRGESAIRMLYWRAIRDLRSWLDDE
jgi:RNA polymerase sigma-70 factor (ECF subfamily)